MDNSGGVRSDERVGDLDRYPDRLVEPHPVSRDQRVERFAGHALHDNKVDSVVMRHVMYHYNIRVVEGRGGLRFLDKPLLAARVGNGIGGQELQRNHAVEARIPGLVHFAHASRTERYDDLVGAKATTGR